MYPNSRHRQELGSTAAGIAAPPPISCTIHQTFTLSPPPHVQNEKRLAELESAAAAAGREGDDAIVQYKSLLGRLAELEAAVRAVCVQPQHCQQFLRAGRIVAVRDGEVRGGAFLLCAGPHFIVHKFTVTQHRSQTLHPQLFPVFSTYTLPSPKHAD